MTVATDVLNAPRSSLQVLGSWHLDTTVLIVLVLAAVAYLAGVRQLRRRGESWPLRRTALFLVAGLGGIAVVTMSALGVYDRTLFWPAATQNAVLLTLTPLLLSLGDPIGLVTRCLPARSLPRGRIVTVLAFPMVSALLCLAATLVLYLTPLFRISLTDGAVHQLVWLGLVGLGCLFCWPMLSEQLLPEWCGYPMRMAFGFVDGLLDAIPGIIVMTGHGLIAGAYYASLHRGWGPSLRWDQTIGGGLMLTIAEATAVPFAVALFFRWARADEAGARLADARLAAGVDATGVAGTVGSGAGADRRVADGTATGSSGADRAPVGELQKPWWETDPGPLADRTPRRPR
ncbi:MAG TPA: cytochrome c oxidase assembly protein [Mycobacteriales bacterium]|nr:cytochrome c oxidase assembly protein [Mycobacteriales bacterium]